MLRKMKRQTMPGSHLRALLQALLVTIIWSLSLVLIKIGLTGIAPITFAGLRYTLAFACLLIIALRSPSDRTQLRTLRCGDWGRLALLGFVYYALTQGAQFAALAYLPSVTLSLLLSFTPIAVAILGLLLLNERPTPRQYAGIALFVLGVLIYFVPISLPAQQGIGLLIGIFGMIANALSSILGRYTNRGSHLSARVVTTVSMGVGGVLLLVGGLTVEGMPQMGSGAWALVIWLALVHTAFAFTLWNHTLRVLTAIESSLVNNLMLVQIALLAWIFLGEAISPKEIVGLGGAVVGVFAVQLGGIVTESRSRSALGWVRRR